MTQKINYQWRNVHHSCQVNYKGPNFVKISKFCPKITIRFHNLENVCFLIKEHVRFGIIDNDNCLTCFWTCMILNRQHWYFKMFTRKLYGFGSSTCIFKTHQFETWMCLNQRPWSFVYKSQGTCMVLDYRQWYLLSISWNMYAFESTALLILNSHKETVWCVDHRQW